MNRFIRFFKRLFEPPELSHSAAQEAKRRKNIAARITDDEIYVQTVRNALKVPDASLSDKLTFAFTSLPNVTTNFPYAKNLFIDIIDFMISEFYDMKIKSSNTKPPHQLLHNGIINSGTTLRTQDIIKDLIRR